MSQDRVLRCPECGVSGEKMIHEVTGFVQTAENEIYDTVNLECEACGHEW